MLIAREGGQDMARSRVARTKSPWSRETGRARRSSCRRSGRGRRKEFCFRYPLARSRQGLQESQAPYVALFEEQLAQHAARGRGIRRKAEEGTFTPEELMSIHAEARVALERSATVLELGAPPGADRV